MNTAAALSRCRCISFRIASLFPRRTRCHSPKARRRGALPRLSALFVDLLLDMACLFIRDGGPGIEVANLRELAEALCAEGIPPSPALLASEFAPASQAWRKEAA